MAIGDTYWFVAGVEKIFDAGGLDFGATPNTVKVALIKSAANGGVDPTPTLAYPTWGAAGSTDLSASEVTPGGNYSAGGAECASAGSTINGATLEIDFTNAPTWASNGSNPTNARWAIYYDDTSADKVCFAYKDLGLDRDMSSGSLTITEGTPSLKAVVSTP